MEKHWDYVVIGSGPGGAVTAQTLTERGKRILIIEEGSTFAPDEQKAFGLSDFALKYRNSGLTFALGKPKISYVEGALWGGGSEVNAGLYHRTPESVLANWTSEFGLKAASTNEMEPHFKFVEDLLKIEMDPHPSDASLVLKSGAEKLGWQAIQVPRWIHNGERQSMSVTALKIAQTQGAKTLTRTRVQKLKANGRRWSMQLSNGQVISAKQVYVCAGAIQTPALLLRSGIRKNIGRSLQLHPSIKYVAQFSKQINSAHAGIPSHQVKEFAPLISMGGSISSLAHLAVALAEYPEALANIQKTWTSMSTYYAMIRPTARGKVRHIPFLNSTQSYFQISDEDAQNLLAGFLHLGRLLFAAGAKTLYPSLAGGHVIQSPDELKKITVRDIAKKARLMTIHLFSSCPMGENKNLSATDSYGRVHDHGGLYINDASLLCTSLGVNPQGSIMAFARRNALQHLADGDE